MGSSCCADCPAGTRTLKVRAVGWGSRRRCPSSSRGRPRVMSPFHSSPRPRSCRRSSSPRPSTPVFTGSGSTTEAQGRRPFPTMDDIQNRVATEFVDLMSQMPGVLRRAGPGGEDFLSATRGPGRLRELRIDGMPVPGNDARGYQHCRASHADRRRRGVPAIEQPAQWAYTTPPTPAPFSIDQNNKLNASGRQGSIDSLGQAGGTGCVKIYHPGTSNRLGV